MKSWGDLAMMLNKVFEAFLGQYQGEGIDQDGQKFAAQLSLSPLLDGKAFTICFDAQSPGDGNFVHHERSWIAPDLTSDQLALWTLSTNHPGMIRHDFRREEWSADGQCQSLVFGLNDPADLFTFREEIMLSLWKSGDLEYHYSWGLPKGEFAHRSGARMSRIAKKAAPN